MLNEDCGLVLHTLCCEHKHICMCIVQWAQDPLAVWPEHDVGSSTQLCLHVDASASSHMGSTYRLDPINL